MGVDATYSTHSTNLCNCSIYVSPICALLPDRARFFLPRIVFRPKFLRLIDLRSSYGEC